MQRLIPILLYSLSLPVLHAAHIPSAQKNEQYLQENIKKLNQGKTLSKKKRTRMLTIACSLPSPKKSLITTKRLLKTFQQKNYAFNKHRVMSHAIKYAHPSLIEYLLQQKIHHPKLLEKQVHYDLVYKTKLFRLFEVDFRQLRILPKIVTLIFTLISYANIALILITLVRKGFKTLRSRISKASAFIGSLAPIIWIIKFLIILYYGFSKLGIHPNYLVITLKTDRSRKDKTAIIQLLLKYGAHPHLQSLYITPNLTKQEDSATELIRLNYNPSRYELIHPIHLAAQQELLDVVQALVAHGADLNELAYYMEDAIDTTGIQPKTSMVTLTEIYRRKGKHVTCKSLLDIAPHGSPTYQYLRDKKVKKYKKPGTKKKKKRKKNS